MFIEWAPTSSYIAYKADQDIVDVKELYLTTPTATPADVPIKVNTPLSGSGDVEQFAWSPDGRHIAYRDHKSIAYRYDLFVFTPATLTRRQVSATGPAPSTTASLFEWSPDSSQLAYKLVTTAATTTDLYTVNADGTGNVRINPLLQSGAAVREYEWSPDNLQIAYTSDQETLGVLELFVATPGVPGTTKLNAALSGAFVQDHQWSPDGTRLIYSAGLVSSGELQAEMLVVDAGGLGVTQLDSVFVDSYSPFTQYYQWSPDGLRVTYVTAENTGGKRVIRSVSAAGGVPVKLSGTLEDIFSFIYLPQ